MRNGIFYEIFEITDLLYKIYVQTFIAMANASIQVFIYLQQLYNQISVFTRCKVFN